MKLSDINPFSIKGADRGELLNLHLRCHQLWSLATAGSGKVRYNKVIIKAAHRHIVAEMQERKYRHRYINDLDSGVSYVTEGYPENPDTVIVQNSYYPKGLTEEQIYNYYMSVKKPLLKYLFGRKVGFFLSIDGQIIVKRPKTVLTNSNYENIISGRTLSIHIERSSAPTNYLVIDVDRGKDVSNPALLYATGTAKKLLKDKFHNVILKHDLLFTGNGIHYILYFKKKFDINELRKITIETLQKQTDYPITTSQKKRHDRIHFDMVSNWPKAMHISKYSLTKEGLRVLDLRESAVKLSKKGYKISEYKIRR